jgi:hypothetical protein
MFFEKKTKSLEIAKGLIKNTGLDENLGILKQKKHSGTAHGQEFLEMVMGLCACNLVQTLKADFIRKAFSPEELDAITAEYVRESLRRQELVELKGEKHIEIIRLSIMPVVGELQTFWKEEEDQQGGGPGPRYYCVKEVLRRLGGKTDYDLHDALFELMYLQHKHYLSYFREFLKGVA